MTGDTLRALRERRGLTQKQAALWLGVKTNSVARHERGEKKIPEPTARLARILLGGERPADILREVDDT